MKKAATVFLFVAGLCVASTSPGPSLPIKSGDYKFSHRFAEHPSLSSIRLNVRISGSHVTVENPIASDPFPAGVLDEGTLMWHAATKQWIIGNEESDKFAEDVRGCSEGPAVIDLVAKVYWTC